MTKPAKKLLAQPDKKEARARRKAAETLPEEFSLDEVTKIIEAKVAEYKSTKRATNKNLLCRSWRHL